MSKKSNKKEIKKLISLPKETVKVLVELAESNRTKTKPYMEGVLIEHATARSKFMKSRAEI